MREDAFAGMRRVLRGSRADTSGGDLFDALHSQRAVRRFRPEPIADAVLREILAAATRAPSARNAQPWAFVAVRDAAAKAAIGRIYLDAWRRAQAFTAAADTDADIKQRADYVPMMRAVDYLATHLQDAPVLMLCCLDPARLGPMADERGTILAPQSAYASIFPAVQNLMLRGARTRHRLDPHHRLPRRRARPARGGRHPRSHPDRRAGAARLSRPDPSASPPAARWPRSRSSIGGNPLSRRERVEADGSRDGFSPSP